MLSRKQLFLLPFLVTTLALFCRTPATLAQTPDPGHTGLNEFHYTDIYGSEIDFKRIPGSFRLFLFFSRKNQDDYERMQKEVYRHLYFNPDLSIFLVMQKRGIHPMARKKIRREIQESFLKENNTRKKEIGKRYPDLVLLPELFFLMDLDGEISGDLDISQSLRQPTVLITNSSGEKLCYFEEETLGRGLKCLEEIGLLDPIPESYSLEATS